jgi:hypothetical protein
MLRPICLGALLLSLAAPAHAQYYDDDPELRPTGFELSFGLVSPAEADNGSTWGAAVNLGTVWQPWLFLSTGVGRWRSDIDRSGLGDDLDGSIRDFRVYGDLKAIPWYISETVAPYFGAGLAFHFIGAKIPTDKSLEDALSGLGVGIEAKLGVRVGTGSFRPFGEIRRELVDDVGNWAFVAGINAVFED